MFENNLFLKTRSFIMSNENNQLCDELCVISYQDIMKSPRLFVVYVGKYLSKSLFLPVTASPQLISRGARDVLTLSPNLHSEALNVFCHNQ